MNEDRIKLAEAMGWTDIRLHTHGERSAMPPGGDPKWQHHLSLPNPFKDANDDYAVLEWMRNSNFTITQLYEAVIFNSVNYEIGDYARAALKVLSCG